MIKTLYGRSDKLPLIQKTHPLPFMYVTLNLRNTVLNASPFHDPLHDQIVICAEYNPGLAVRCVVRPYSRSIYYIQNLHLLA
jgi:hypothetical protein